MRDYLPDSTPLFFQASLLIGIAWLLIGCGGGTSPPPTPTPAPEVLLGRSVFSQECARCHSTSAETVIVGPSLAGIALQAEDRVAGYDARQYLLASIMRPDEFLVDGFESLMPADLGKKLTGEEVDAVIAYLLTLE